MYEAISIWDTFITLGGENIGLAVRTPYWEHWWLCIEPQFEIYKALGISNMPSKTIKNIV